MTGGGSGSVVVVVGGDMQRGNDQRCQHNDVGSHAQTRQASPAILFLFLLYDHHGRCPPQLVQHFSPW